MQYECQVSFTEQPTKIAETINSGNSFGLGIFHPRPQNVPAHATSFKHSNGLWFWGWNWETSTKAPT